MNKIYYSETKKCLVYLNKKADSRFWDDLWDTESIKKDILGGKQDLFVAPITKQFIKPASSCRILEGGCGKGSYVYSLMHQGYDAYGVDYARKTVEKINKAMPELKITLGDVQSLDFDDSFFNGYWSLGVIEHFWDGFDTIATEMTRVIKKDGFLFLTFPYLSPLRKNKIRNKKYPLIQTSEQPENFYQFALNADEVQKRFEQLGFSLVLKKPFDGLKGMLDETSNTSAQKYLSLFYNTKNPVLRILKLIFTMILAPFSGHIVLLVFKKNTSL